MDPVRGWSEGPSKAVAGQAWGDWPRSRGRCRSSKPFTQPWENLGQPEEGWPALPSTGESTFETRTFQNWLKTKVKRKQVLKMHTIQSMNRNILMLVKICCCYSNRFSICIYFVILWYFYIVPNKCFISAKCYNGLNGHFMRFWHQNVAFVGNQTTTPVTLSVDQCNW